jgi:hypothetical protein
VNAAPGSSAGRTATSSHVALHAVPDGSRRHLGRAGRRQLRRRRLAGLIRLVVFLLLIFVAVWAGVRVAHAGDDATLYTGTPYTVQAGDTLWSIAAAHYGHGLDLRQAVYDIRGANGLGQTTLQPGQRLMLPHEGE